MKQGDTILILPSIPLSEMRLDCLAGLKAIIVEVCSNVGKISGCWVDIQREYLGESEWFIPYNSVGI